MSIAVSFVLHGAPIVTGAVRAQSWEKQQPEVLVVELTGTESDRQVRAQSIGAAEEVARTLPPPEPQVRTDVGRPSELRPGAPLQRQRHQVPTPANAQSEGDPERAAGAPVRVSNDATFAMADSPLPLQAAPSLGEAIPPVGEVSRKGDNASYHQEATTLSPKLRAEQDAIRKYLAILKREIEARLVYPEEARAAGYAGSPVIRFTVMTDGDIVTGSLAIEESSGYAALDASAIEAAQDCVPLPPPPRTMDVSIAVAFRREPGRPLLGAPSGGGG